MRQEKNGLYYKRKVYGRSIKAITRKSRGTDLEDMPLHEPIRRLGHHSDRHQLKVVERWLRSQLGRDWNDIYSELCDSMLAKKINRHDIFMSVGWLVHLHVRVEDNKVFDTQIYGYTSTAELSNNRLYVCPKTNTLKCYTGNKYNYKWREWVDDEVVKIDDYHQYRRISGIWYLVELQDLKVTTVQTLYGPRQLVDTFPAYDHVLRRYLNGGDIYRISRMYGGYKRAVSKRQLNSREIKQLHAK